MTAVAHGQDPAMGINQTRLGLQLINVSIVQGFIIFGPASRGSLLEPLPKSCTDH